MILAAAYEAKRLGIKIMSVRDARLICPDIVVMMPDPAKYRDAHRRFKKILLNYTSEVIPKGLYREPWEYVTNFHVRTKQSQLGNHWLEKITQLVQQLQRREENKVQLVPQ